MSSNAIVQGTPLPAERTRDDEKLARLAASLVTEARRGDVFGVGRLLEGVEPWRLARLFMILGAAADQNEVLIAAGFGKHSLLARMNGRYEQLRKEGVEIADMPPDVVAGRRMYWRMWKREHTAKLAKAG